LAQVVSGVALSYVMLKFFPPNPPLFLGVSLCLL